MDRAVKVVATSRGADRETEREVEDAVDTTFKAFQDMLTAVRSETILHAAESEKK